MKIGLFTFHRSHNYGAILQTFATFNYLKKMGHDVEIIDYWPSYRRGMYDLIDYSYWKKNVSLFKKIKTFILRVITFPQRLIRYKRFKAFIKDNFQIGNKIMYLKGSEIPDNKDLYLFGSDQIWRYNNFLDHKGYDAVYWGKYPENCKGVKATIAASMGVVGDLLNDVGFIQSHINNFDIITVREDVLINKLQPIYKGTIQHVLDPVFLFSKNEWIKLVGIKETVENKKYLLYYNLLHSKEADQVARKIATDKNLSIIEIKGGVGAFEFSKKYPNTVDPAEFLRLINGAEFIVTTSFHGVAFSLIFNKQFIATGMGKNNTRAMSLLRTFGMGNRYITDEKDVYKTIDYKEINPYIDKEALKLKRIIESINKI